MKLNVRRGRTAVENPKLVEIITRLGLDFVKLINLGFAFIEIVKILSAVVLRPVITSGVGVDPVNDSSGLLAISVFDHVKLEDRREKACWSGHWTVHWIV